MASKNSKRFKRQPKHFRKRGLPGRKENVFCVDEKSGHPFVSQAKSGTVVYGHNVTHSPSKNYDGSVKRKYRMFPKKIVPWDTKPSYFDATLLRISIIPKTGKLTGRLKRKAWKLSKSNKRILQKVERERIRRGRKK